MCFLAGATSVHTESVKLELDFVDTVLFFRRVCDLAPNAPFAQATHGFVQKTFRVVYFFFEDMPGSRVLNSMTLGSSTVRRGPSVFVYFIRMCISSFLSMRLIS